MKKILRCTIALILSVVFIGSSPAYAAGRVELGEWNCNPIDYQKFMAFLEQESAIPGYTNEQVIHKTLTDFLENPGVDYLWIDCPGYPGGINAPIWGLKRYEDGLYGMSSVNLYWTAMIWPNGGLKSPIMMYLDPPLAGELEISETKTRYVETPEDHITQIISANVSACHNLISFRFFYQDEFRSFTAYDCPNLEELNIQQCNLREAVIQPKGYDSYVEFKVIGDGSMRLICLYKDDPADRHFVIGPDSWCEENLLGFYSGGDCLSTEIRFEYYGMDKVYICFAGDVNGDDAINMADAVLISRAAMSIIDVESVQPYDTNANGTIDVADAVIAARIGLGA